MTWTALPDHDPRALVDARVHLHLGAEIAASVGRILGEARPDDSHTNLGWRDGVLVGREVGDLQAGLRLADATLVAGGARLPLAGHTRAAAFAWLSERAGATLGPDPRVEMPDLDVFAPDLADCACLAGWFANAAAALAPIAAQPGASEVRCWPHHFDIATLITVRPDPDPEEARTVGVGVSPGDGGVDQPYFYVTPWPYPDERATPALPAGARWQVEGWYGAVLEATAIRAAPDPGGLVAETLARAVALCRRMVG